MATKKSLAFAPPTRTLTMDDYVAMLDPLTRRNTGSRLLYGEDINEQALPVPYMSRFNQQQTQGDTQYQSPIYFAPSNPYQIPRIAPQSIDNSPVFLPTNTPAWLQDYIDRFGGGSVNEQTNAQEIPAGWGDNGDGSLTDPDGNVHYPNGNIRLNTGELLDSSGRVLTDSGATRQTIEQGRQEIIDLLAEADRIQAEDPDRAERIREATRAAEQALIPLERNATRLENLEGRNQATQSAVNALQNYLNDQRSLDTRANRTDPYSGLTDDQISRLSPQQQILARANRAVSSRSRDELRAAGIDLVPNYSDQVDELNNLVNQRNALANQVGNEQEALWAYQDAHGGSSEGFYYDAATGRSGDARVDFPEQFNEQPTIRQQNQNNNVVKNGDLSRMLSQDASYQQGQSSNQNNSQSLGSRLSSVIENTRPTGDNIDFGLSEALRGDLSGAKTIAKNTISQGVDKIGDAISGFASSMNPFSPPKAQAAELSQAGQGTSRAIQNAQSYYQGGQAPSYNQQSIKREVGDSSAGGTQAGNITPFSSLSPAMNTNTIADNRDNFFKAGGAATYGDLVNVDDSYRGALTPELFKDEFYSDGQRVADVFGNSAYGKQATDKFRQSQAQKYPTISASGPDEYGYQNDEGYRNAYNAYRSQVDEYNSGIQNYLSSIPEKLSSGLDWGQLAKGAGNTIKNIGSLFNRNFGMDENTAQDLANSGREAVTYSGAFSAPQKPNIQRPVYKDIINTPELSRPSINAPSRTPTLDEYLARGKTAAQYYAETGQQSVMDQMGGPENYERAVNQAREEQRQAMERAAQMSPGGQTTQQGYLDKAKTNIIQTQGGDRGGVWGANANTQNSNAFVGINGQSRKANTLSEYERALILSGNAWGIKR